MDWFDIFNTRETALLIWLAFVTPIALWFPIPRGILGGLFKTFARATALHQYLLITLIWVALEVWLLAMVGLWSVADIKATILWAFAVPMLATWRLLRFREKETFVLKALRDTFALTILVEFVVDFYPLALWAEFLLVPIAVALTWSLEAGKKQEGTDAATMLFEWLLGALGLIVLVHAALSALADIQNVFSFNTLIQLVGPITLTVLFLPYLFAVAVFVTYANAFLRIKSTIEDEELRRFAHFHTILAFGWRLELLRRWSRDISAGFAASKQDIRRSILEVFEARNRERNPPKVADEEGWSPNIARHFLDEYGLPTQDYHRAADELDYWWTQSSPVKIDGTLPKDALFLYIEGTQQAAKQLKLALGMWNQDPKLISRQALLEAARILVRKATGEELPDIASSAVLAGETCQVELAGKALIVQANMDDGATLDCVSLIIRTPDWKPPSE